MEVEKMSFPKDWEMITLGEACQVLDNLRKPINSDERQSRIAGKSTKELFPYYGATGQVGWIDGFLTEGEYVLIGEDGAPFLDRFKPKAYAIKGKSWVNNHAHILQEKDGITINEFILHYLNSVNYHGHVNGTTRLKLTKGSLVNIPFPLPPLVEQQRIVAKIEELFSELDAGKGALEKATQQLKVYRQAVLKWAFEGRLTNDAVVDGELPDGWEWQRLGDYVESIGAGKSFKCDERAPREGEVGIVKVSSVTWGYFDEEESKTCFSNDLLNPAYLIKKDDFLFSRANTIDLIGACVIAGEVKKTLMLSDKILRIKFTEQLLQKYAMHYLRSRKGRSEIEKLSTGNQESMRNIGQEKIKQISIPVPPLEEQHRIVQEIESRLSVCDKIEGTIAQSLQQAEALRQSILKKAFEGKLVVAPKKQRKRKDPREHPAERKALATYLIWLHYREPNFGKTWFQKELHLSEYVSEVEYETDYAQLEYGPWDSFIEDLFKEAAEKNWFTVSDIPGMQSRFEPGENIRNAFETHIPYLRTHSDKLKVVRGLLGEAENLDEAELYSTVYAVWNNCLIRGEELTRERLIAGVRAWSKGKEKYGDEDIWEASVTLEDCGLKPCGKGKEILKFELQ